MFGEVWETCWKTVESLLRYDIISSTLGEELNVLKCVKSLIMFPVCTKYFFFCLATVFYANLFQ